MVEAYFNLSGSDLIATKREFYRSKPGRTRNKHVGNGETRITILGEGFVATLFAGKEDGQVSFSAHTVEKAKELCEEFKLGKLFDEPDFSEGEEYLSPNGSLWLSWDKMVTIK